MKLQKENKLAKEALGEADRKPKKAKKDVKQQEKVLAAMMASRAYTSPMLGTGHKKGGAQWHAKNRRQVLVQVREVGELSPEQQFHWHLFKTAWDESIVAFQRDKWAGAFAEMMQKILQDLLAGRLTHYLYSWRTRRPVC